MDVVIPAPAHEHFLPTAEDYPDGTLACCPICHRWFRRTEVYVSFGSSPVWAPVRWYHWRLRRRTQPHMDKPSAQPGLTLEAPQYDYQRKDRP